MIRSFGDTRTRAFFERRAVSAFSGIARPAQRKLAMLHAATSLDELRIPPANRLERLRGDLDGFWSIRINDQWRVIFRWSGQHADDVRIVDYH